jgi:hypothetical protein
MQRDELRRLLADGRSTFLTPARTTPPLHAARADGSLRDSPPRASRATATIRATIRSWKSAGDNTGRQRRHRPAERRELLRRRAVGGHRAAHRPFPSAPQQPGTHWAEGAHAPAHPSPGAAPQQAKPAWQVTPQQTTAGHPPTPALHAHASGSASGAPSLASPSLSGIASVAASAGLSGLAASPASEPSVEDCPSLGAAASSSVDVPPPHARVAAREAARSGIRIVEGMRICDP